MNFDISTQDGMDNAVTWLKAHLDTIKDGGTWIVPRSMSIITIDHQHKTATVVASMMPEESSRKVFDALGWKWVDKSE